jgi:hypothetical protein
MTECSTSLTLSPVRKKPVTVRNDGGDLTSDAGVLLLRDVDRGIGLIGGLVKCLRDPRQQAKVRHTLEVLVGQRMLQMAAGYEDCNDADSLRTDPALKLALEKALSAPPLASQSTLSRFENRITRQDCYRLSEAMLECYLARHREAPPARIILDFDPTDDKTHGQQQFSFYQAHYGSHCYLPLLVFAQCEEGGEQELLAAVLRAGNVHGGKRALALLTRLVARLRAAFPKCRIEFRADSGFALPEIYAGCEALKVGYTISLPKNDVLLRLAGPWLDCAQALYQETGGTVQVFGEFRYQAHSWSRARRVIVKAEWMAQGPNPRFVVTSSSTLTPASRYRFYCQRGDVENRIKELKEGLQADRLSCHRFLANQLRLLLHGAAYVLLQTLRQRLAGTALANAQVGTLRLKLLKVGAQIKESTRRIVISLPSAYPWFGLWSLLLPAHPG